MQKKKPSRKRLINLLFIDKSIITLSLMRSKCGADGRFRKQVWLQSRQKKVIQQKSGSDEDDRKEDNSEEDEW